MRFGWWLSAAAGLVVAVGAGAGLYAYAIADRGPDLPSPADIADQVVIDYMGDDGAVVEAARLLRPRHAQGERGPRADPVPDAPPPLDAA